MTYAYDNYIQLPTVDLYDTQMMAMAINAAKDMYDRGQQQIKDFYKEYGDFMSPFAKDMEAYGNMVGGVRNLINTAYANGIDLLRSPEGRALISKAVYSVDPAQFNRMRMNAKAGWEYLKNVEEAKAKNEFSQEFEDWLLSKENGGPGSLNDFSSEGGAMWNRVGPGRYQTIDQLIEPIVKNVDYSYDEAMTKSRNDGNDYYTITRDRLMQAVNDNMSDILASQPGGFHYWKALQAAGGDKELARQILNEQIGNRLSDHEKVKFEANPFKLDDYRTNNDIRATAAKEQVRAQYELLGDYDFNLNGKLDEDEKKVAIAYRTKGKGITGDASPNIFREAEAKTGGQKQYVGELTTYQLPEHYNKLDMDPAKQAEQVILQDKATKKDIVGWKYSGDQMKELGTMYVLGEDGQMHYSKINNPESGYYTFIPGGSIRAKYIGKDKSGNKRYRYFISGHFIDPVGHNINNSTNGQTQWVEVTERSADYVQSKQK